MPGIERFIDPVVERINLVVSHIQRVRELKRKIRRDHEYGRSLDYNPDGSKKSFTQREADAKRNVLAMSKSILGSPSRDIATGVKVDGIRSLAEILPEDLTTLSKLRDREDYDISVPVFDDQGNLLYYANSKGPLP